MKSNLKLVAAGAGVVLAILSFWSAIPLAVPVICVGIAVLLD